MPPVHPRSRGEHCRPLCYATAMFDFDRDIFGAGEPGGLGTLLWDAIVLLGLGIMVCWGLPLLLLAIVFFR